MPPSLQLKSRPFQLPLFPFPLGLQYHGHDLPPLLFLSVRYCGQGCFSFCAHGRPSCFSPCHFTACPRWIFCARCVAAPLCSSRELLPFFSSSSNHMIRNANCYISRILSPILILVNQNLCPSKSTYIHLIKAMCVHVYSHLSMSINCLFYFIS
jgi:hypothetical protein